MTPQTSARTLRDYRPQHDADCDRRRCIHCNEKWDQHVAKAFGRFSCFDFIAGKCTCGLDTLLAADAGAAVSIEQHEKDHGAELAADDSVSVSVPTPQLPHDAVLDALEAVREMVCGVTSEGWHEREGDARKSYQDAVNDALAVICGRMKELLGVADVCACGHIREIHVDGHGCYGPWLLPDQANARCACAAFQVGEG